MTFKSDHACLQAKPLDLSKLIYCSRTVPELEKVKLTNKLNFLVIFLAIIIDSI